jgi:hypothetical protein
VNPNAALADFLLCCRSRSRRFWLKFTRLFQVNKVRRGSTHRPSNGQPRQAYIKRKNVLDVTAYEMVSSSVRMHDCNNGSNCEVNGIWD